ncbi:MAG: hypothetical protein NC313_14590 [Butyrivibrio sp.]|nr:hypothetical protein [Butyrivibrio sp.]
MKIFKFIKYLFLFLVIGITVLLELGSRYLLKQNIEFTDKLVIFKMIMTWFVTPFTIIMYYNNTMTWRLRDNPEMIAAVSLSNGMVIFVLSFFFILRIIFWELFQDRVETQLENGIVIVEYENFAPNQTLKYQSINQFLYKHIEK